MARPAGLPEAAGHCRDPGFPRAAGHSRASGIAVPFGGYFLGSGAGILGAGLSVTKRAVAHSQHNADADANANGDYDGSDTHGRL